MKISQKGLYALQAMMMLARHHHQGAIRIRDIAYEEGLPEKFLELILLELKNARMVESVRGAKGGYQLRRDPSDLALSEIIRLIDGPLAPFGDADHLKELIDRDLAHRSLYKVFLEVRDAAARILEHTTLADLIDARGPRASAANKLSKKLKKETASILPMVVGGQKVNSNKYLGLVVVLAISISAWGQTAIRVGAFPNITHAQAMVGKNNGFFDKAMGSNVKIQWTSFNAGPAAIEALFAGAIDMTYVGPNPAINGYVRSNGEALRVIAGAASGGASLVVRNDAGINKPEDFHGKRVASPQFGNTQDVALRSWLKKNGLKTNDKGGDVQIVPMANPDQLTLFLRKDLDASWAPEPWATRLIHEGNGRLLVDERTLWPDGQFVIGLLVVNTKFYNEHPDLVKNWIRANVDLTDWINAHKDEAKKLLNDQIQKETGKPLAPAILDEAFSRMQVTYDPLHTALNTAAQQAFDNGSLGRTMPDLSRLYDLKLLNEVLAEKKRKAIQ